MLVSPQSTVPVAPRIPEDTSYLVDFRGREPEAAPPSNTLTVEKALAMYSGETRYGARRRSNADSRQKVTTPDGSVFDVCMPKDMSVVVTAKVTCGKPDVVGQITPHLKIETVIPSKPLAQRAAQGGVKRRIACVCNKLVGYHLERVHISPDNRTQLFGHAGPHFAALMAFDPVVYEGSQLQQRTQHHWLRLVRSVGFSAASKLPKHIGTAVGVTRSKKSLTAAPIAETTPKVAAPASAAPQMNWLTFADSLLDLLEPSFIESTGTLNLDKPLHISTALGDLEIPQGPLSIRSEIVASTDEDHVQLEIKKLDIKDGDPTCDTAGKRLDLSITGTTHFTDHGIRVEDLQIKIRRLETPGRLPFGDLFTLLIGPSPSAGIPPNAVLRGDLHIPFQGPSSGHFNLSLPLRAPGGIPLPGTPWLRVGPTETFHRTSVSWGPDYAELPQTPRQAPSE